jgi:transposase-like protein
MRRQFTLAFKLKVIKHYEDGKSFTRTSKEFIIDRETLRSWVASKELEVKANKTRVQWFKNGLSRNGTSGLLMVDREPYQRRLCRLSRNQAQSFEPHERYKVVRCVSRLVGKVIKSAQTLVETFYYNWCTKAKKLRSNSLKFR